MHVGRCGVLCAVIAFFAGVEFAVTARARDEATVFAIVGKRMIERGRLALFAEHRFHFAVAADADFEEAGIVAAVIVALVAVIAFLSAFKDAVAANRRGGNEGLLHE